MYPYYPHMIVMASMVVYLEAPNWQWHYDHAMSFMYLMGHAQGRLYIFFQHSFAVSIMSPFFGPEAPFDEIPLYMAHPTFAPPSPPPPPSASMEIDLSEASSFSSASTASDSEHPPGSPEASGIMENGFYTPRLD